jgi:hypothetical protein
MTRLGRLATQPRDLFHRRFEVRSYAPSHSRSYPHRLPACHPECRARHALIYPAISLSHPCLSPTLVPSTATPVAHAHPPRRVAPFRPPSPLAHPRASTLALRLSHPPCPSPISSYYTSMPTPSHPARLSPILASFHPASCHLAFSPTLPPLEQ